MRCSGDGELSVAAETYHSLSCGWYLNIPESWWDWNVEAVTGSISNENQLNLNINGDPVLSIYTITGENRENRGRLGKRTSCAARQPPSTPVSCTTPAPITAWMRICCAAASTSSWALGATDKEETV